MGVDPNNFESSLKAQTLLPSWFSSLQLTEFLEFLFSFWEFYQLLFITNLWLASSRMQGIW